MDRTAIDPYLDALPEPKRGTLLEVRRRIRTILPEAEECVSYGMPAFRVGGKVVAGFAAFTNHLSYLPHSGSVLDKLPEELAGYTMSKGSLHFAVDAPLPTELLRKLIAVRQHELRAGKRR